MPRSVGSLRPSRPPVTEAEHDANRRRAHPWRALYGTSAWRAIRQAQLADEPLCRFCSAQGRVTAATVCDHVMPHKGNPELFFGGPFQSLCKPCHDGAKQRQERGAAPANGWRS